MANSTLTKCKVRWPEGWSVGVSCFVERKKNPPPKEARVTVVGGRCEIVLCSANMWHKYGWNWQFVLMWFCVSVCSYFMLGLVSGELHKCKEHAHRCRDKAPTARHMRQVWSEDAIDAEYVWHQVGWFLCHISQLLPHLVYIYSFNWKPVVKPQLGSRKYTNKQCNKKQCCLAWWSLMALGI